MFHTTSSAARELGIPSHTLLGWIRRGDVGPFERDAAGRRLLTEQDLEALRQYRDSRKQLRRAA
jgi:DNA-binding transcriptional MerR regulator